MVLEKLAKAERDAAIYLATWDLRYGTLGKDDFYTSLSAIFFIFSHEVDWLLGFLKNVKSPVVFSHNDLNCGNILVSLLKMK